MTGTHRETGNPSVYSYYMDDNVTAKKYEFTVVNSTLSSPDYSYVSDMKADNDTYLCGISSWQSGTEYDITDCTLSFGSFAANSKAGTIFRFTDNGTLQFELKGPDEWSLTNAVYPGSLKCSQFGPASDNDFLEELCIDPSGSSKNQDFSGYYSPSFTSLVAEKSGSLVLDNYTLSGVYASPCVSDTDWIGSWSPENAQAVREATTITGSDSLTNEILFYSDSSCSQLAVFEAMSLDNVTFESHGSYGGLLISGNLHSEMLSAQTQDGANWYNTRDSNSSMNVQSGDNWTISNLGKRWSELLIDQDSIRLTRFYSDNASGVNDPFYSSIPQTKQPGIT
ncbi:TPA: hypothetical protein EYO77_06740, partial [Candidatus Poribacteria bacterium]|nr:hypothetical protein [Candidatus Poribacteria bacterium]